MVDVDVVDAVVVDSVVELATDAIVGTSGVFDVAGSSPDASSENVVVDTAVD